MKIIILALLLSGCSLQYAAKVGGESGALTKEEYFADQARKDKVIEQLVGFVNAELKEKKGKEEKK